MKYNCKSLFLLFIAMLMLSSIESISKQSKLPFTFEDAMKFKTIRGTTISQDGGWLAYGVVPDRGDGELFLRSTSDTTSYIIPRGTATKFASNSLWAAYEIMPNSIEIENAKTPKDRPKNTFGFINLSSGAKFERANVSKFEFSNDAVWLAYHFSGTSTDDKDKKLKDKSVGELFTLRHLPTGTEIKIDNVGEFLFDSLSNYIFYTISSKTGEGDGVYFRKLKEAFAPEFPIKVQEKSHSVNLAYTESGNRLAFQFAELTDSGKPIDYSILLWRASMETMLESLITDADFSTKYYIPQKNTLNWTKDGNRLFFGYKYINEKYETSEKSKYNDNNFYHLDSIIDRADLYVWHWDDPLIMSNQRNRWNRDKDLSYRAVFDTDGKRTILLGDSLINDVSTADNPFFTVGRGDNAYRKERTWYGNVFDIYSINLKSGERRLIEKRVETMPHLSPDGKLIVYYKDKHWYAYVNEKRESYCLTDEIVYPFFEEDFDLPMNVPPYGFGGWVDNGEYFLLYDKYDIWMVESRSFTIINATSAEGRINDITFRIRNLDRKKEFFEYEEEIILSGFSNRTKSTGIYTFSPKVVGATLQLKEDGKRFNVFAKSEFQDKYLFTKDCYREFPDIWLSEGITFSSNKKISNANPEMEKYQWGSTELVRWQNSRGDTLEGFIIKPDGFDPKKKYPVYVYYYERFSDRLNSFFVPMLNHRPIMQVYNSSGYVMFLPDIKYYIGYPGHDALDAIMTGSKKLIDMGIADPDKFCIQGHSWSGYQTALIVTQTDFFKAACAGAPVGNMTSAYSQIRLESGLTRQFQYEAQQSRIGGTLWDSLQNYIASSPIFHVNKTNTPMLIMFGDIDEAVPWQQGIELYMAYRRLSKNAIFLQYENEPHHPRKYQNKADYAIKMKEFFDHYVLGKPAKDWILRGIPYRGK